MVAVGSTEGIFVIEAKNMDGWIFGEVKSAQWTQSLFGKKYWFQNPLHQNYRHNHLSLFYDLSTVLEEPAHLILDVRPDRLCQFLVDGFLVSRNDKWHGLAAL